MVRVQLIYFLPLIHFEEPKKMGRMSVLSPVPQMLAMMVDLEDDDEWAMADELEDDDFDR